MPQTLMAQQSYLLNALFEMDRDPSMHSSCHSSMLGGYPPSSYPSSLPSSLPSFDDCWSPGHDRSSSSKRLTAQYRQNRGMAQLNNYVRESFPDCRTIQPPFYSSSSSSRNYMPSSFDPPLSHGFAQHKLEQPCARQPSVNLVGDLGWDRWDVSGDPASLGINAPCSVVDWNSQLQISPLDAQSWNNMIMPTSMANPLTSYTPHFSMTAADLASLHRISPHPSPSPPPAYDQQNSTSACPPAKSRRPSLDRSGVAKKCSHCQATSTPLWRRDPTTFKTLCNACGLYLQQRNKFRPQELIDADTDDGDTTDSSDGNYIGPECSHCRTHHTSVWRRSKTGAQLCNACGVYARLRGKPRPLSLKRNKIKPRTKHAPTK